MLTPDSWDSWLDGTASFSEVMNFAKPTSPELWQTWKVDRALARPNRNGPEAVYPVTDGGGDAND